MTSHYSDNKFNELVVAKRIIAIAEHPLTPLRLNKYLYIADKLHGVIEDKLIQYNESTGPILVNTFNYFSKYNGIKIPTLLGNFTELPIDFNLIKTIKTCAVISDNDLINITKRTYN